MKALFFCVGLLFMLSTYAQPKGSQKNKTARSKTAVKTKAKKPETNSAETIRLTSASTHGAWSGTRRFSIADPVTNTLNAKANGAAIDVGKSGLMGMPKRAFGFANGHITLKPNSATSTGTINGSGSVGTGTFPGSISAGSMVPGVNGKNPYAGVDIWGTHLTGSGIQIKEAQPKSKQ